jgi:hypothetical protein
MSWLVDDGLATIDGNSICWISDELIVTLSPARAVTLNLESQNYFAKIEIKFLCDKNQLEISLVCHMVQQDQARSRAVVLTMQSKR